MPAFAFAAKNASRLRKLPLYALGWVVARFVPRTHRLWVFGCGIGPAEGALPLLTAARARLGSRVRLVWLATTERELAYAQDLGLDAVRKLSARGFWLTLRARVLVVTHGLGDVNPYAGSGGFVVQLWHGIPLKCLHLDAPVALHASGRLRRIVTVFTYRRMGRQLDLFAVSAASIVDRIVSAFGVRRENVVVTGDPRDDVLLQGTPDDRRRTARAAIVEAIGAVPDGARLVVYAPTWRDGAVDPAAPGAADWGKIARWLEDVNAVLVVRVHPLGRGDYSVGPARSDRVRLLDADMIADVTPVLPAFDHLVTDYSSIAFDFALVGGSTVFLAADIDSYVSTRGLYEPYRVFSGGAAVATWPHALRLLDGLVRGDPDALAAAQAHTRWLVDEHFDHLDGRATTRVLDEILHRTAGGPAVAATPVPHPRLTGVVLGDTHVALTFDATVGPLRDARFEGPRAAVTGDVTANDDGTTSVLFTLRAVRWGGPELPLPSGAYRLTLGRDGGATTRVDVAVPGLPTRQGETAWTALEADGGLVLSVRRATAPRPGPDLVARLRTPLADAVLFESFYGRAHSDNPAGIDRALARLRPDVTRYWSVSDAAIALPPGAVPVLEGSTAWRAARASARVRVVNDWLRDSYVPRRGQRVLQTWHGTMLKRLALDRPEPSLRTKLAVHRQSRRWDALLAQNEYSAHIFRSSYAYGGPIWVTGYPRNDVLHDDARRARVRESVGVPAGADVVLYAPTWRDDRAALVDYLDLVDFAAGLPDGHVLLVRGHSRTIGHGHDLRGERLVDVTSYPDIADLMLVADVLVTDYSSVMFDFATTGKPMIFYTPDMAHYEQDLRGFYFDLAATAPGPIVHTRQQLLDALATAVKGGGDEYAERYRRWRATYVPLDDGRAGERVVQRLIAEGWLG